MTEQDVNLSKEFVDKISPKSIYKKNKINGVKKLSQLQVAKGVLVNQRERSTLR